MKAAVCTGLGSVVIKDVAKPAPADKEVLVRVHATTICAADYRVRSMHPVRWITRLFRPTKPSILGMELSGTVEAVGKAVTRFRPGDQVFGGTGFKLGAHAEYACAREIALELKPANMTLEDSAAITFGGLTAIGFLRDAKIQAGQNVLVYGASGSVGVFAVQLAKHFGARVTGVCSTANVEMVKSLGADQVIDYTREDFSAGGQVYDMFFDTVGKSDYRQGLKALKPGSPYVIIAMSGGLMSLPGDVVRQIWVFRGGRAKAMGGVTKPQAGDLAFFKELIEAGKLRTIIDRRYPFEKIAEAFSYAEKGHKKGHVIVQVEQAREAATD